MRFLGEEIGREIVKDAQIDKLHAVIKITIEPHPKGLVIGYTTRNAFAEWLQSLDVEKRGNLIETICADLKDHLIDRAVRK